jgi:hypothetical protein
MPLAAKAPLEKLPLATRKDVRDNFENGKADLEKQIGDLLGRPYTLDINMNACLAYSTTTDNGSALTNYIKYFTTNLESYLKTHGEEGKKYFNEAVSHSKISLAVEPSGEKSSTTAKVIDGSFVILFPHDSFGSWQRINDDDFLKAVDEVPRADNALPLIVKNGIKNDYDSEIDKVREEIAAILNIPDIILQPNFDANYAFLKKQEKMSWGWDSGLGKATIDYLKGCQNQLVSQGFKGDDMLQEGIQEVLTTKTIEVCAVDKLEKKQTNEAILKDGKLYLRALPGDWGSWCSYVGEGILEQL